MDFLDAEFGDQAAGIRKLFVEEFAQISDATERHATRFRVLSNLDPNSSVNIGKDKPYALEQLRNWLNWDGLEGYSPADIVRMSSEELNPDRNKSQRMLFESRLNEKIVVKDNDMYSCRRKDCGSKKVSATEIQIRRIDEPANVRVVCSVCYEVYII